MRFGYAFLLQFAVIGLAGTDCVPSDSPSSDFESVVVSPEYVRIRGSWNRSSLLVTGRRKDGRLVDLTDRASFRAASDTIFHVSSTGVIFPRGGGESRVEVEASGIKVSVPVSVAGMMEPRRFQFENDIEPLLGKFGCNSSACHGKAEGQNGFKLSVFGSEPFEDFLRLTREGRGRRMFLTSPERSLLLTKASGSVPHGGGIRIPKNSVEYRTLEEWIANGTSFGGSEDFQVVSLRVEPTERQLEMNSRQRLRVTAVYSNGEEIDVTHLSRFQSNNETVCAVDSSGLCTTSDVPGDAVMMAGYLGFVGVFRAVVPRSDVVSPTTKPSSVNFIDELVDQKLRKLNIVVSEPANDAEFLRRVSIDTIGTLPTASETRLFLADESPDRRLRLVNGLLARPEFSENWALKWADAFRVDRRSLGHQAAYAYYRWIRDSLTANKPYDLMVRELITAEGPLTESPAGHFYKLDSDSGKMASMLSQMFLGIRIDCAKCHHHPFDRWSQSDYFGMQAFFTQVRFKQGIDGDVLFCKPDEGAVDSRTGEMVRACALGESVPSQNPMGDRRRILAAWMTAPENPWFAQNLVNRVWAHFLGRGMIEPVDDVRLTNPSSNPELLQALSAHFVASKYDLRELIRTITSSRTYQLSSKPNQTNERDEQNFSRALFKQIDAEVLADALSQVTGIAEKFPGVPAGARAIQLWDNEVPHYFLRTFGRPERSTPCTCERSVEPNVAQVLHLFNAPELQAKLSHDAGRIAKLTRQFDSDEALIEELFLTIYSRFPSSHEKQIVTKYFVARAGQRRQSAEDLAWSLLNTPEFLFNH